MKINKWRSITGAFHKRIHPKEDDTENPEWISGLVDYWLWKTGIYGSDENNTSSLYSKELYGKIKKHKVLPGDIGITEISGPGWKTTPVSDHFSKSRDEWQGLRLKGWVHDRTSFEFNTYRWDVIRENCPIFHKQLWGQFWNDVPMQMIFKWPWTRYIPGLTIGPKLSILVSCFQTHKKRGGDPIAKTDGKMMGMATADVLGWKWTYKLAHCLVFKLWRDKPQPRNVTRKLMMSTNSSGQWKWTGHHELALDWFDDRSHPIVCLATQWDNQKQDKG